MENITGFGLIVLLSPTALLTALGVGSLIGRPLGEVGTGRLVRLTMAMGLFAALGVLALMLWEGTRYVNVLSLEWIGIPHYQFWLKFVFDRLSVPLVILTFLLCGTIGSFVDRSQAMNAAPMTTPKPTAPRVSGLVQPTSLPFTIAYTASISDPVTDSAAITASSGCSRFSFWA